ncbi:hypothetical protein HDU88_008480 [Geranomyces variabilis]|nr:hypothetical protein HDU88_008480 [Geranomyces variabilis]
MNANGQALVAGGFLIAAQLAYQVNQALTPGATPSWVEDVWWLVFPLYAFLLWKLPVPNPPFAGWVYVVVAVTLCMLSFGVPGIVDQAITSHRGLTHRGSSHAPKAAPVIDPWFKESDHILGSHKVHVLPPTVATVVTERPYCLGHSQKSATIPVRIKGTPPWSITYEVWGYDGSHHTFPNIAFGEAPSAAEGQSEKKTRVVRTYDIIATQPGLYRLLSVRESLGDQARVIQERAIVVDCPSGSLITAESNQPVHRVDRCYDDSYTFDLKLSGTPELSAWYLRQVADERSWTKVEGDPNGVSQPSMKKSVLNSLKKKHIPEDLLELLLETQSRDQTIAVPVKIESATEYLFKLGQVADGRNNSVRYPSLTEYPADEGYRVSANDQSRTIIVQGRARPSAKFGSCDEARIRTYYPDEGVMLPVQLEGTGPWDFKFDRASSEEATDYELRPALNGVEDPRPRIHVKQAGFYTLRSISDRYCTGEVGLPATCLVQAANAPTLDISKKETVTECFGATGASAILTMTGEPSFWVEIDEHNKETGSRNTRRYDFKKAVETLHFRPKEPGEYEYVFSKIGDKIYPEGVPIRDIRFSQTVHAVSDARFAGDQTDRKLCVGDTANFEIQFSGKPPYSLSYQLIKGSQKLPFTITSENRSHSITLPPFSHSGKYHLELNELTDGNRCTTSVASRSILVEVLAPRPRAQFHCPRPIPMLEGGRARMPVTVSGHGKYRLRFKPQEGGSADEAVVRALSDISEIEVGKPGIYELVAFEDQYCQGEIIPNKKECEVVLLERPTVSIPTSPKDPRMRVQDGVLTREPVCQGQYDEMHVDLTGKPQFRITYIHEHSQDGKGASRSEEHTWAEQDRRGSSFADIDLVTDVHGLHTYTILNVIDDNYRTPLPVSGAGGTPLRFQQRVHAKPTALFPDKQDRVSQCISEESDTEFRLQLTGLAPYTITVHRKHESHPGMDMNVTSATSEFKYRPERPTATGKYTYTIKSVVDANGCERSYRDTDPGARVTIQVADMARIAIIGDATRPCAGDMLSYSLEGSAPFTVSYTWNGKKQPNVRAMDDVMMLFAGNGGTVNVTSVCNSVNCCYYPRGGLVTHVNPLPRAIVDEGDNKVENIREGGESDIRFEFQGTGPYSFGYSRTPLYDPEEEEPPKSEEYAVENVGSPVSHQRVQQKTWQWSCFRSRIHAYEILARQYHITTDLEGLFRVTWIEDQFCRYPRKVAADPKLANAQLR